MLVRLGPSASEVHEVDEANPVADLVKSLSHLQHVLKDPKMRSVIRVLSPHLLDAFPLDAEPKPSNPKVKEIEDARRGQPSSSKVGQPPPLRIDCPKPDASKPSTPKSTPVTSPAATSPDESKAEPSVTVNVKTEANAKALEKLDVNSATHRAAHARLTRRMEKLDPAQFPNMCKLWSGSRKERILK